MNRQPGIAMRIFAVAILCFATPVQATAAHAKADHAVKVGTLIGMHGFTEGGCILLHPSDSYQSDRYVFLSDFDGNALMSINGVETKLRSARSRENRRAPKVGERSSAWYTGRGVQVRIDFVVSDLCPVDDESCEVIYYKAVVRVVNGPSATSLKAHGLCGS